MLTDIVYIYTIYIYIHIDMTDTNGNTILPDGFTLFHLGAAPTVYSDAVTGPPRFVVSPAEIRDGRGVK